MSYIISNTSPFVSIKLTETGRQKLASGALNFSFWAIGDSEINYDRESLMDLNTTAPYQNLTNTSKILRPKDRNPNIKYYITKDGLTNLNTLQNGNINVIKAVVNNEAENRGFFTETLSGFTTISSTTYIVSSTTVTNSVFTGGTQAILTGLTYALGDLLLIKFNGFGSTGQTQYSNNVPLQNLWYKIGSGSTGSTINVDRVLPNFSAFTSTTSQVIVYPQGEVWDIYGSSSVPYWNSGTLSFDSCCDVTCSDVPIWNQNNVWCESPAGFTGITDGSLLYEQYWDFGSFDYLGQKHPYLYYPCSEDTTNSDIICDTPGQSIIDPVKKSIGIIHYTNNLVSNVYGEFFYINNSGKTVTIEIPDLMWHRREYATSAATEMGMTFIASGDTKYIPNSTIEYVDLIEDPDKVSDPVSVGRVFPQLKTIVLDDDELIAATSYKSNRNWSLPPLSANLVAPNSSTISGAVATDKTMYLTYMFDNTETGSTTGYTTGFTTSLPCQYYTKITNTTPTPKDIQFKINSVDELPYMKKVETSSYDGTGFYGRKFKVLWQVVDEPSDRPSPDAWKIYDFTSTAITTTTGQTINPILLENQNPVVNGFLINQPVTTASTTFSLYNILNLPLDSESTKLQFGDERFFYGNVKAHIGATIFKTLFRVSIDANQFNHTSNPTFDSDSGINKRISEIGIYDSNKELVMIGKLSRPVSIGNNTIITLELSIDF